jgi:hypothetical protein
LLTAYSGSGAINNENGEHRGNASDHGDMFHSCPTLR